MNPNNRIYQSREFAHKGHDSIKQIRKYTNEPYWNHTDEVAGIVLDIVLPSRYTGEPFTKEQFQEADDIIIAAHLHDLIEDVFPINPYYSLQTINNYFGINVMRLVRELTDVYTKESYPHLNREQRKKLESERLSKISKSAKIIKLADLISNTKSIVEHDPDFARIYIKEKERVLESIQDGNEILYKRNLEIIKKAKEQLGL